MYLKVSDADNIRVDMEELQTMTFGGYICCLDKKPYLFDILTQRYPQRIIKTCGIRFNMEARTIGSTDTCNLIFVQCWVAVGVWTVTIPLHFTPSRLNINIHMHKCI